MGQVAQATRRLATGWTSWFDPGCRRNGDFSSLLRVQTGPRVHSDSYKMRKRLSSGVKGPTVGLATTLPLPSAVAMYMWTLASTFPVGMVCKVDIPLP